MHKKETIYLWSLSMISEFSALYYTYLVGDMIRYIKNNSEDVKPAEGYKLVAVFVSLMLVA